MTDSVSPAPSARQLPEGLRQEMEDWKIQMMGAIQDRMDNLQGHFQVLLQMSFPLRNKSPLSGLLHLQRLGLSNSSEACRKHAPCTLLQRYAIRAYKSKLGAAICLQSPGRVESLSVDKLRLQMVQLEDVVSHMAETQASFASNNTGDCMHLVSLSSSAYYAQMSQRRVGFDSAYMRCMTLAFCNAHKYIPWTCLHKL